MRLPYIAGVLGAVNLVSFGLMVADKQRARRGMRRVRERTLMLWAAAGGALGALAGMYTVRHKTQHRLFTLGVPLLLALQIGLALWLLRPAWWG